MSLSSLIAVEKTRQKGRLKEAFLFLKRWSKDPRSMGSLVPSSQHLSEKMVDQVYLKENHFLVELGGGTGSLTRALRARYSPERFCVVEKDLSLVNHLRSLFPDVLVIHGDATDLCSLLPTPFYKKVSTVISGLPLLTLPLSTQRKIIHGCLETLVSDGRLVQFTYSPFSSLAADQYGLTKSFKGMVFNNFPPASIWSYETSSETVRFKKTA